MKPIRLALLSAFLLFCLSEAPAQVDPPPAAQEVLKQFEEEAAEIDKQAEAELRKSRDKVAAELKKVQDAFCKEAKLDEAVAVRDLIRSLQAGTDGPLTADLPAAAREVYKQYE